MRVQVAVTGNIRYRMVSLPYDREYEYTKYKATFHAVVYL
jgi:hypothetical protein